MIGSALAEGLHFLKYKAFPDIFGNFTLHREGKGRKINYLKFTSGRGQGGLVCISRQFTIYNAT
jgi:hypothetical protein